MNECKFLKRFKSIDFSTEKNRIKKIHKCDYILVRRCHSAHRRATICAWAEHFANAVKFAKQGDKLILEYSIKHGQDVKVNA
jgi:hypothetical protein